MDFLKDKIKNIIFTSTFESENSISLYFSLKVKNVLYKLSLE